MACSTALFLFPSTAHFILVVPTSMASSSPSSDVERCRGNVLSWILQSRVTTCLQANRQPCSRSSCCISACSSHCACGAWSRNLILHLPQLPAPAQSAQPWLRLASKRTCSKGCPNLACTLRTSPVTTMISTFTTVQAVCRLGAKVQPARSRQPALHVA